VALSTVGVALLAGGGDTSLTTGALLTLGGAVCFAGHITGLSQWANPANAYGLTAWSVCVAALICGAAAVVGGDLAVPPSSSAWLSIAYLALAATCLGFVVQAWAQSALTATTAAVVMTMEPVFAALLAATIGDELLTAVGWFGGLLIVSSMFIAELGPRDCCDALSPRVECC
ncbi:MAG: DMT family transporter, partial [Candidatus Nanopelagicales bacterium]